MASASQRNTEEGKIMILLTNERFFVWRLYEENQLLAAKAAFHNEA